MSKRNMILGCLLFLGSVGTLKATPMDSPDVVYIDGLPCNSLCQSYMAWSRNASSVPREQPASAQSARLPSKTAAHRASVPREERSKPAAQVRVAKHPAPESIKMPRAKPADVQPAAKTAADSYGAQTKIVQSHPSSEAAPGSDATRAKIADSSPAGDAAGSNTRATAIQEQVTAATAVALRMTVATVAPEAEPKANDANRSDHAETAILGDAEKTRSTPPNDSDLLVALLMARPEIKSVSDLTNKAIAIDDGEAASNDSVRTAIAAAGATEVQLSETQPRAINRLISGDVPAAVLALVSPEAAEGFPEIAGFRIFRIPLSPRSLKARL